MITRKERLLAQYPNAPIDSECEGALLLKPCLLDSELHNNFCHKYKNCKNCRIAYWLKNERTDL